MDIFLQNQSSYTTGKFFSHSHNIHENKQSHYELILNIQMMIQWNKVYNL